MDKLPQELVDRISGYLTKDDLKSTLLVSRRFSHPAERLSGAFKSYLLTEENASDFLQIYASHRFKWLQKLKFRPRFPPLRKRDRDVPCCQSPDQLQERDEEFTRQISFLFLTLKELEKRVDEESNVELRLYTPVRGIEHEVCLHQFYISWRVHLLNPDTLPQLQSVRSFVLKQGADFNEAAKEGITLFKLDLRILVDLMIKFPNLEYMSSQIGQNEWSLYWQENKTCTEYLRDWEGPRRDSRHDFGAAISANASKIPRGLKSVFLSFLGRLFPGQDQSEFIDHRVRLPDLVGPRLYCPFTNGLRILSTHLRRLCIRACIDEIFFRLPDSPSEPYWPCLETLEIVFHPVHPRGAWYFEGPKGEGRDIDGFPVTDSCYPPLNSEEYYNEVDAGYDSRTDKREIPDSVRFRVSPTEKTLRPLLYSFAKAAVEMPALKEFSLWAPLLYQIDDMGLSDPTVVSYGVPVTAPTYNILTPYMQEGKFCEPLAWGIAYITPDVSVPSYYELAGPPFQRRLFWKVANWRADAELHGLFREIGRSKYGEPLYESFHDKDYGNQLVFRGVLEEGGFVNGIDKRREEPRRSGGDRRPWVGCYCCPHLDWVVDEDEWDTSR